MVLSPCPQSWDDYLANGPVPTDPAKTAAAQSDAAAHLGNLAVPAADRL